MGTRGALPDMYTLTPHSSGLSEHIRQTTRAMLQLLCYQVSVGIRSRTVWHGHSSISPLTTYIAAQCSLHFQHIHYTLRYSKVYRSVR